MTNKILMKFSRKKENKESKNDKKTKEYRRKKKQECLWVTNKKKECVFLITGNNHTEKEFKFIDNYQRRKK